ncbi:MAG: ATP-binding protein [Myxococcota bacterium]
MILRFGDFAFDEERFELRSRGSLVSLPALAMDTLALLIKNRGKLVAVEQLIAGPWRGQVVSHSAIRQVVVTLRRALGDDPASPKLIQTVRGKGFRFASEATPVTEFASSSGLPIDGASTRFAATTSGAPLFFGRENELETLRRAAHDAASGRGRLLLLLGEQGIGKTALVERFAREADPAELSVLRGRCWEAGGAPALWPWPEVMRAWMNLHGASATAKLAGERLDDLARLLPELDPKPGRAWSDVDLDDSVQTRFRVFDSVKTFLRRGGEQHPLAIIIEDAHCADDGALLLLEHLASAVADSRVVIVATCRPFEASRRPWLEAAARGAHPSVGVITLSGLSPNALSEWLCTTEAGANAPNLIDASAKVLHEFTGGHPLLVQEAIRRLSSLGTLNELRHAMSSALELPARVTAAIRERIGPLPGETARLLQDAALLGREFRVSDLPPRGEGDKQQLLELLAPAVSAHVLETPLPGQLGFRFSHDLVREAFVVELSLEERTARHAAIACHLAARAESDDDDLWFRVARHALAGHPVQPLPEVLDSLLRASECARRKLDYELSESFCNDGLALARSEAGDPERRAALMLSLATTHTLQGRNKEADADFLACAEFAWTHGLHDTVGHSVLGWFRLLGEHAAVHQAFQTWVQRAIELAAEPGSLRAQLLCALTVACFATMPAERSRELLLQAHDMVKDSPAALVAFVGELDRHQQHIGDPHGSLAAADAALASIRRGDVAGSIHRARLVRMGCLIELGRGAELLAEIGAHIADCARQPYPEHVIDRRADWLDYLRALLAGDLAQAELGARRIREARGAESLAATSLFAGQALSLALESVEPDRTRLVQESLACAHAVLAFVPNYAPLMCSIALSQALLGQLEESRAGIDRFAEAGLEVIPDDRLRPVCLCMLGMASSLTGHMLQPAVYAALERFAGRHVGVQLEVYLGPVSWYLGELSRSLGDFERAKQWFKRSLLEAEQACSRPWTGRARRSLASCS